jgi:chemotaxis protein methyltransferase CheR
MMLRDSCPELAGWRVEILATDIAPAILDRARQGSYSGFEVQRGLPVQLLVKHFDQRGDNWHIKPELQRMVNFQRFNLLDDPARLGTFDIVLCRNVLIYFDQPTKAQVLDRIADRLADGGTLLLGAAESIFGITTAFAAVKNLRGVYRKAGIGAEPSQPLEFKRAAVGK